ncbi:MAG TPA: HlyD family efflux transporter periplasmic adaptor subunit [Bacteroidales bacterium]|nr:HlyD family efflux transporter periplasmic adaptor subunit [Bacteroidales bacterium]
MKALSILSQFIIVLVIVSCSGNNHKSDAYGNFETVDVLVASEMQGRLVAFNIEEGQQVKAGEQVGLIDTIQLSLKRDQMVAQRKMSSTKFQNIQSQIQVQEDQKKTLLIEKRRLENLMKDNAATQRQMDDINGKVSVIESQIASIKTQNSTVINEVEMLDKQIAQVNDQINRSKIINPIDGTVLEKYFEAQEIATPGKTLYKVADISKMILRAYVSGAELSQVKIGTKVKVLIDESNDKMRELTGTITWVSQQAEFTPKIIQTKEERVNLVYAVKIEVPNDGSLKIGMPGEVKFN